MKKEFEEGAGGNRNLGELKPSRLHHCWDTLEFWEESWRHVETRYYPDSSEKPPALAGVKNLIGIMVTMIWKALEKDKLNIA